jgi:hypothetical protein
MNAVSRSNLHPRWEGRNNKGGGWSDLHNEELHDLCSTFNFAGVIRLRRIGLAGNAARIVNRVGGGVYWIQWPVADFYKQNNNVWVLMKGRTFVEYLSDWQLLKTEPSCRIDLIMTYEGSDLLHDLGWIGRGLQSSEVTEENGDNFWTDWRKRR